VSAAGSKSVANTADEFEDIAEPTKTENFTDLRIHVERGTDITPKPINWLWLNRFPVGKMTLVAGFPDQGKSQVMLKIAATISTGGDWPDGSGSVDEGVVIIVSSEDDAADTLLPRFMAAREKRENILIVKSIVREKRNGKNTTRVFNVADDLGQVSEVIRREAANGRTVRMVGFDPLNAYFGGPLKADSHKNADMRALLTPIAEWAARLKIATVGIMHFNKGGNGHALYRITDSLAISASARAAWFCVEDQESGDHLFIQGKKNLSKGVAGLTYSIAEPTLAKAESVHLMSYGATLRQRPPTKLWPLSVSESRKRSTPLCANLKHF
jgi:putative DNA primase/helicase